MFHCKIFCVISLQLKLSHLDLLQLSHWDDSKEMPQYVFIIRWIGSKFTSVLHQAL